MLSIWLVPYRKFYVLFSWVRVACIAKSLISIHPSQINGILNQANEGYIKGV